MKKLLYLSAALLPLSFLVPPAQAQSDYVGEVRLYPYNFCPRGSLEANGQLLAISSNQALFSLYGTTFGGDGRTTFALPDLRGRVPIHTGTGPGLSPQPLGSRGGEERTIMSVNQFPNHAHRAGIKTTDDPPNSPTPYTNSFTNSRGNAFVDGDIPVEPGAGNPRFMNPATIYVEPSGGGQSQNNMMPYQTIIYCVSSFGIYPSRN